MDTVALYRACTIIQTLVFPRTHISEIDRWIQWIPSHSVCMFSTVENTCDLWIRFKLHAHPYQNKCYENRITTHFQHATDEWNCHVGNQWHANVCRLTLEEKSICNHCIVPKYLAFLWYFNRKLIWDKTWIISSRYDEIYPHDFPSSQPLLLSFRAFIEISFHSLVFELLSFVHIMLAECVPYSEDF